jgi:hypothetical protein
MSWQAKRYEQYVRASDRPTTHHRKPKSRGGGNGDNISEIPASKHKAWHTLFRDFTPEMIAQEINEKYLDKDYFLVVKRR